MELLLIQLPSASYSPTSIRIASTYLFVDFVLLSRYVLVALFHHQRIFTLVIFQTVSSRAQTYWHSKMPNAYQHQGIAQNQQKLCLNCDDIIWSLSIYSRSLTGHGQSERFFVLCHSSFRSEFSVSAEWQRNNHYTAHIVFRCLSLSLSLSLWLEESSMLSVAVVAVVVGVRACLWNLYLCATSTSFVRRSIASCLSMFHSCLLLSFLIRQYIY